MHINISSSRHWLTLSLMIPWYLSIRTPIWYIRNPYNSLFSKFQSVQMVCIYSSFNIWLCWIILSYTHASYILCIVLKFFLYNIVGLHYFYLFKKIVWKLSSLLFDFYKLVHVCYSGQIKQISLFHSLQKQQHICTWRSMHVFIEYVNKLCMWVRLYVHICWYECTLNLCKYMVL